MSISGCFATAIQLALLPAAHLNLLKEDVAVNAITGSTGAGQKPGATTHFSWRNNNLSIYKPFQHQHIAEIRQSLKQVQGYLDADIDFIPYRGDFARGIFCTAGAPLIGASVIACHATASLKASRHAEGVQGICIETILLLSTQYNHLTYLY